MTAPDRVLCVEHSFDTKNDMDDGAYLAKLRTYWKRHQAFPSMAKLTEVVGLSSTSSVFALVGLLSILPTLRILQWRRRARSEPDFALTAADVAAVRPFMIAEAVLFGLIPVFAAMMVRGFGQ